MSPNRRLAAPTFWAALCLASLLAPPAVAQQDKLAQARTFFNAGVQAYDAGKYLVAVQAFDQAYRLTPREGLIFSKAQSYRRQFYIDNRQDHLQAALKAYRDYLNKAPEGSRRADAAEALAELSPLATTPEGEEPAVPPPPPKLETRFVISSKTKGARIALDGGPPQDLPLIATVKPGNHQIVVTGEGYVAESREVPAAEGGIVALNIDLKEQPAQLRLTAEEGAQLSIDGRPAGTTPLAAPVKLPSGTHLVTLALNGREGFAEEVDLTRGEERELTVDLDNTGQRWAAWVFLAAGGAAAVGGGVLTGIAWNEQRLARKIDDESETANIQPGQLVDYNDHLDNRDRWRTAAAASFGAGVLFGVTGFLLYAFDQPTIQAPAPPPGPKDDDRPETDSDPGDATMEVGALPAHVPGGAVVLIQGRF